MWGTPLKDMLYQAFGFTARIWDTFYVQSIKLDALSVRCCASVASVGEKGKKSCRNHYAGCLRYAKHREL